MAWIVATIERTWNLNRGDAGELMGRNGGVTKMLLDQIKSTARGICIEEAADHQQQQKSRGKTVPPEIVNFVAKITDALN